MVPENVRKLGWFVALSLLAHLLIIYEVPMKIARRTAEPLILEARLQPAAPLPPVLPRPIRAPAPKPAVAPVVETMSASPRMTVPPAIVPDVQPIPEPAVTEPTLPDTSAVAPSAIVEDKPAPPLARRLPQNGEITYALYLGNSKFNVGRTSQTWAIKDDHYRLTSMSETSGLAALFVRQSLDYVSTGRLTPGGLRPDFFGSERLRSGKTEAAAAKFDWNALTVTLSEPQRSVPLPVNAQDMVSFMYQLGLQPLVPGRIELPITNGWKLEPYVFEVGIEEQLQTPFAMLRVVPVKQVRKPGQESIELWLSPDYRWLPVRIRFFNRQGEPSGEQLVSEIRVSAD